MIIFAKHFNITYITGLWNCLDKTKRECNLYKIIFNLYSIYQIIFTLPLKARVFHFKLIHPFSQIHVILVSQYLPVQTHQNGREIERKLRSVVLPFLANSYSFCKIIVDALGQDLFIEASTCHNMTLDTYSF